MTHNSSRFCVEDGDTPYWGWRGEALAGAMALMFGQEAQAVLCQPPAKQEVPQWCIHLEDIFQVVRCAARSGVQALEVIEITSAGKRRQSESAASRPSECTGYLLLCVSQKP